MGSKTILLLGLLAMILLIASEVSARELSQTSTVPPIRRLRRQMGLKNPSIKEADMEDTLVAVTPVVDMEETEEDTLVAVPLVVDMEETVEVVVAEEATAAMAAVARAITEGVAGAVHLLVRQWMLNLKQSLTTNSHLRNSVFFKRCCILRMNRRLGDVQYPFIVDGLYFVPVMQAQS
ncbi:uncharacterized protein LOC111371535 [Olea europaea var. sylvestris]|uniref:uncharacterized protein LOC111371535 n=1 Tax=Olea europaea var. sylvestris TaxID=158386 RepID=UPI000C1D7141|nr:uncharacterized protein LOC111371535 [Olea europaea var. sylvestris]